MAIFFTWILFIAAIASLWGWRDSQVILNYLAGHYPDPGLAAKRNQRWHWITAIMMILIFLGFGYLLSPAVGIPRAASLLAIAIPVCLDGHNIAIALGRGLSVNIYGQSDGWWDLDGLLLWLKSKGIEQHVFWAILFTIFTAIYFLL